jgi:uncharacterized protein (TIGR02145 family)/uncharacterized repeat protein (TIGR02543 family)
MYLKKGGFCVMMYKSVKKSAAAIAAVLATAIFAAIFCTGCTDEEPPPSGETEYKVTFSANGGGGTPPSAVTVISGSAITLPNGDGLTKSGHTFGGWNTESGGGGTNYGAGSPYTPAGDVTLYAKWNVYGIFYGEPVTIGNEIYQTVIIGNQTWFARNLNYDVPNDATDKCFEDNAEYCEIYGRMYSWNTALTACPADWHLPTDDEWLELMNFVGESPATKLKSPTIWDGENEVDVGTNDYGFSAMPGGRHGGSQGWRDLGVRGNWWTATEYDVASARSRSMRYSGGTVYEFDNAKIDLHSVRCVKN